MARSVRSPGRLARVLRGLAALCLIAAPVLAVSAQEQQPTGERAGNAPGQVLLTDIDGPIGPATAAHVIRTIEEAEERGAALLVLRIDTPGGLVTAMRDINNAILGADVAVASYVSPEGARAASAGTYILYASHVAAMAPTTTLGAATPVSLGGAPGQPSPGQPSPSPGESPAEDTGDGGGDGGDAGDGETPENGGEAAEGTPDEETPASPSNSEALSNKAINDAVATIRALAERRGRNADWAEKAVREAATLTARAAAERNVVDFVAESVADLLEQADGLTVTLSGGQETTLATADASVERVERSTVIAILEVLSNPNVALLLMTIGFYGLIFELANPGIGPGIPGVICLVLGLYSLNQLPIDYAGLALVALGLTFMTVEAVTPSFGVFGIGGIVAFGFGATMLIDTDMPQYQVSPALVWTTALVSAAFLAVVMRLVYRAQRGGDRTGLSALVGQPARVLEWSGTEGRVHLAGERWRARGPRGLSEGTPARVRDVDGLTVEIEPDRD